MKTLKTVLTGTFALVLFLNISLMTSESSFKIEVGNKAVASTPANGLCWLKIKRGGSLSKLACQILVDESLETCINVNDVSTYDIIMSDCLSVE